MVRTVIFFIVFWGYQICILPILLALLVRRARGHHEAVRRTAGRVAWVWSELLMGVAGARLRIWGEVNLPLDKPVLYVSNHQGAFDVPLALIAIGRPVAFISKIEMARIPSIGAWMKLKGCIFVDRGRVATAQQTLDEAVQALKDGVSLVVFPEGTRSGGREMRPFKAGFARIAIRSGAPIVPIVMNGTYKMKSRDAPWITSATVEVAVEQPISTTEFTEADCHELRDRVQSVIQARLDRSDPLPASADLRRDSNDR